MGQYRGGQEEQEEQEEQVEQGPSGAPLWSNTPEYLFLVANMAAKNFTLKTRKRFLAGHLRNKRRTNVFVMAKK